MGPYETKLSTLMSKLRLLTNTEDTSTIVSAAETKKLISDSIVVLPAGGKGTRIRAETQSNEINMVMIEIDDNRSMIEKVIQDYTDCGFSNFLVLTDFLADKIEDHLGNGSRLNVDISYSEPPNFGRVGVAGSILNALLNGSLSKEKTAFVHSPNDFIVGLKEPYPQLFAESHVKGLQKGCIATIIVVPESPYQYSAMIVQDSIVKEFTKYPSITLPSFTGISVLSPETYPYFKQLVSLEAESSLDSVLLPTLVKEKRLFAKNIPCECWIPINDLRGLEFATLSLKAQRIEAQDASSVQNDEKFEVALSFAGEQRNYVEQVAFLLKDKFKINVFYDKFYSVELWGKSLSEQLHSIFERYSQYCIIFASNDYARKHYPTLEKRSALSDEIKFLGDRILVVRFDDTELPGIPSDTSYLRSRDYTPDSLAEAITKKIRDFPDRYLY